MHVIFKRLPTGRTIMMMFPWLPVELIKQNNAIIDYDDVLTVLEPREELVTYYTKASLNANSLLGDIDIGESLIAEHQEMSDDYLDGEEELDDEELSEEESEELFEERKKHLIH
jgi:ribosome assembly protein YihI (activator of Der GTPase)